MHAIVGVFKMAREHAAEQQVELHERIIPMVRQLPGFVSGYWTRDPVTNRHFSHLVFDSPEAAQQLASIVKGRAREPQRQDFGVEIESLTVAEVIGSAVP